MFIVDHFIVIKENLQVLDLFPNILPKLTHLIVTTVPWDRYYNYLNFSKEET